MFLSPASPARYALTSPQRPDHNPPEREVTTVAGAVSAGSIEYTLGLDDSAFLRGLAGIPALVNRQSAATGQAGQRLGNQLGSGIADSTSTALQRQLQGALRQRIQQAASGLPDIVVGSDTSAVDRGLADVKQRLAALSSQTIGVDVDAATAQRQIGELLADLRQVAAQSPDVQVRASAEQAIRQLEAVRSAATGLPNGTVRVDADTSAAENALRDLGETPSAGDAGGEIGGNLSEGLSGAVEKLGTKAGPIVGSIIGAVNLVAGLGLGALLWKALESGFEQESRSGLFKAQTGLDAATVARYGRAAGESYAQNFGESVADNLEAARAALGTGLLGGQSTQVEITDVTNKLQTVAQILGEEVPAVARAAGQAVKTGLADNATEAFDLITKAQQAGLNTSEDLLDTLNEYGTQYRKLGIDGPTALGLISQALQGGARDADLAADAIKEFSLRSISGTGDVSQAYLDLGLDISDTVNGLAAGGQTARDTFQTVLDAIAGLDDPLYRAQISTALFGTQAEDLGAALNNLNLDKAQQQFADTAGAIDQAMADIGNNTAGQIETAKRSVETVLNNVSAAVATTLGPAIGQAADWIASNRAQVTQWVMEVGHAFIEGVGIIAEQTANGLEAMSHFAPVLKSLGTQFFEFSMGAVAAWKALPFTDNAEADRTLDNLQALGTSFRSSMDAVGAASEDGANAIRTTVIPAVENAQDRFDAIAIPAVAQAAFSDATTRLGKGLDDVATSAGQTQGAIDRMTGTVNTSTTAGQTLDTQLRTVASSMLDQAAKGATLGQSQQELTGRYNAGRDALIGQLTQMGLTREEAERLANQYGLVPGKVDTIVSDRGTAAAVKAEVERLNGEIGRVQDRTVTITARLALGSSAGKTSNGWSGGTVAKAMGGSVHGPGSGTSDDIPAWLSNGEHVWTDAEVRAAGGHERVKNLRRAALSGELPAFAQGGPVGDNLRVDMTDPGAFQRSAGSAWDELLGAAQSAADSAARAAQAADEAGGATAGPPSGTGSGWAWQVATIKKAFPNIAITSTTRPGAKTVSGNTSYHARGRAIDMSPSMAAFNWIAQNFPNTAELIFSPAGARQLKNGRSHIYSGAVKAMHYNHVHWAYDQGGVATGKGFLPKLTPQPERVLSPEQTRSFDRLVDALTAGQIGAGSGRGPVSIQIDHHNTLTDTAIAAVVARQEALELAGYLGMDGV